MDWRARLRAELGRRKWADVDLGREMRLKRPESVTRWLDGTHQPRWDRVVAMAHAVGWTVAMLLEEEGFPDDDADPNEVRRYWLSMTKDAKKVARLLGNPRAAAFLAHAADQWAELTRSGQAT